MPAALDRPSGMLEMTIAASTATPTPWPPSSDSPSTIDSGMPSSSAPTAMAVPLPDCCLAGLRDVRLGAGALAVPGAAGVEDEVGGDVRRRAE